MSIGQAQSMGISRMAYEERTFINKVYSWMGLALLLTAAVAWYVAGNEQLIRQIMMNRPIFWGLIIAEFGLVFFLTARINHMSAATATAAFLGYSALNGVVLSFIFVIYTAQSIALTFVITSGMFIAMSIYGFVTKQDLTKLGNLCFMALIGMIIASVANWFVQSQALMWVVSYIGVAVFTGLIAYDTQKIKRINSGGFDGSEGMKKMAVMGALALYLDFINLFLILLRFFGGSRD